MNAHELMTKHVVTCRIDENLAVAAQRMWEHDCGVIPIVTHEGALVGILTDRDICMATLFSGRPANAIGIAEAMSKQVAFVRPGQGVEAVSRLMADMKVRRIPVVDTGETLLGIISITDIAREAAKPGAKVERNNVRAIDTLAAICQPRGGPAARAL
ncbi:MAG TPA: CBS domain-containing protein [Kofleriaceae bacterium]